MVLKIEGRNNNFSDSFLGKIKSPVYVFPFSMREGKVCFRLMDGKYDFIRVYPEPEIDNNELLIRTHLNEKDMFSHNSKPIELISLGAVKALVYLAKIKDEASNDKDYKWFEYDNLPNNLSRLVIGVLNNVYNNKLLKQTMEEHVKYAKKAK